MKRKPPKGSVGVDSRQKRTTSRSTTVRQTEEAMVTFSPGKENIDPEFSRKPSQRRSIGGRIEKRSRRPNLSSLKVLLGISSLQTCNVDENIPPSDECVPDKNSADLCELRAQDNWTALLEAADAATSVSTPEVKPVRSGRLAEKWQAVKRRTTALIGRRVDSTPPASESPIASRLRRRSAFRVNVARKKSKPDAGSSPAHLANVSNGVGCTPKTSCSSFCANAASFYQHNRDSVADIIYDDVFRDMDSSTVDANDNNVFCPMQYEMNSPRGAIRYSLRHVKSVMDCNSPMESVVDTETNHDASQQTKRTKAVPKASSVKVKKVTRAEVEEESKGAMRVDAGHTPRHNRKAIDYEERLI